MRAQKRLGADPRYAVTSPRAQYRDAYRDTPDVYRDSEMFSSWTCQLWRQPLLRVLHMLDLLPESVVAELRGRFGAQFDDLGHGERLILATAAIEQVVNHTRLAEISDLHPHDLSLALARLEREVMLHSDGRSRAKVYFLPGARPISPEQVFAEAPSSGHLEPSSGYIEASSGYLDSSSGHIETAEGSAHRDAEGCLLTDLLDRPIVDDLETLAPLLRMQLEALAQAPRNKPKLDRSVMESVILAVCKGRYVTLGVLAKLMDRNPDALRRNYLDGLVKTRRIQRAFPGKPTHEKQSYRTVEDDEIGERA